MEFHLTTTLLTARECPWLCSLFENEHGKCDSTQELLWGSEVVFDSPDVIVLNLWIGRYGLGALKRNPALDEKRNGSVKKHCSVPDWHRRAR